MVTATSRIVTIRRDEAAACIDFDQALEAYLDGADPDEQLRAAIVVLGSAVPVEPERAEIIAAVTGCTCGSPTTTMPPGPCAAGSTR